MFAHNNIEFYHPPKNPYSLEKRNSENILNIRHSYRKPDNEKETKLRVTDENKHDAQ